MNGKHSIPFKILFLIYKWKPIANSNRK